MPSTAILLRGDWWPMQQRQSVFSSRRRYFGLLLAAGVTALVAWLIVLPALRAQNFGITLYPNGRIEIRDFPSHLMFAKAFWKGNANYDVQSYIRVTSEWAGRPLGLGLPFPYSPTMLWLLAPLCALPTAWAFTVWTIFGLCVVWWLAGPRWPMWVGLAFFSPTAMVCFSLGQTVVLSTAAMLCLVSLSAAADPKNARTGWHVWLGAVVLWALSAKPQVAVTAGVALLAGRQWRMVLAAVAMTLFSTLLLVPRFGIEGLEGYLGMLAHYDTQATEFFSRTLFPEKMGNLRAFLHITLGLGDTFSFRCSAVLWGCALVGLLWAARAGMLDDTQRWSLAILAYVMFCPHLVATEELHLVLILALLGDWRAQARPLASATAVALALSVLFLLGLVETHALRIALVFAAKLGLAVVLIARSFAVPIERPELQSAYAASSTT